VKYTIDKVAQMFVVTQARRSCQAHFRHRFNILPLPDHLERTSFSFIVETQYNLWTIAYIMPSKEKEMPHSWHFVVEANHRGTIEDLDLALLAAFEESEEAYNICVTSARANACVWNKADRLEYLLDQDHVDINKIGAASVSSTYESSPKDLAAVLVLRGWDINQRQPVNGTYNSARGDECNKKLVKLVCRDEEMVQWCLDHGAIVDETDETLLADVASYGSIKTFKLLREHGAPISESTLHNAA
jgi:hypothetical protein